MAVCKKAGEIFFLGSNFLLLGFKVVLISFLAANFRLFVSFCKYHS